MFDQLVSSGVNRRVAPFRGLVVGMLHGILIAGAIRVTARPAEPAAVDRVPIQIIYEQRRDPVTRTAPSDPASPSDPVERSPLPRAPVDVPPDLPPVTVGRPIDPIALRHALSTGMPGGPPAGGDSVSIASVLVASEVDEPAVVIHQPSPRYPPVLQQAGLEGRVLVDFIIDTTGHIEAASLRVLESSNAGFVPAAGETIRHSRFRPARVHGRPVRQRTVQAIVFRIVPER